MFNSNIKNLLTKKVTIVFLVFILALIFIYPKITNSQETSLAVSANEYELVSGEKATITIETKYATAINKSVALSVENNNEALKQKSCVFKSDGVRVFCQVEFNSTTFGSFYVEAKYLTYTAKNTKPIIVSASCPNGDEVLTNGQCTKCVSPQIPNETKTSCITPTSLDGDSTQNSNSEDGTQSSNSTDTTYSPLARLPGLKETIDTSTSCAFGNYLNIMIKLIIGLAAVMAMVMITMGGIEYMTSELISGKEAGKETVQHALLGLVLALSAYLILNTINPKLLNACLDNLPEAVITIQDFDVPGSLTFDGKPIKVNFNKEAYPAARLAKQKTGVNIAFTLAIFNQETGSGKNVGRCNWQNANMKQKEKEALQILASSNELNIPIDSIPVSCSNGTGTHGGAIGLTQFIPTTWMSQRIEAEKYLGHKPNPWDATDALMMTATLMKNIGALSDEYNAACKYYSGDPCIPNRQPPNKFYGDQVMGKKSSIQKQIDEAIKKGEITP